jgi:hypothetical protein
MSRSEKSEWSLREKIPSYLAEVVIIFVGISMSFLYDEWREKRQNEETATKHMISIRENLVQDTTVLSKYIEFAHEIIRCTELMAYDSDKLNNLDTFDYCIDMTASYIDFSPNITAFDEMKSNGHTKLIVNDSLRKAINKYYTLIVNNCDEWSVVCKNFTLNQVIPEMSNYFSVAKDRQNKISLTEKLRGIRSRKVRNNLITTAFYNKSFIYVLEGTKISCINIIRGINIELAKGN